MGRASQESGEASARPADGLLVEAVHFGYRAIAVELIEAGVDPNMVLAGDMGRDCLLREAAGGGDADIVRLLLDRGATPDGAPPGRGHLTPLMRAVYLGHADVVKVLLRARADPNARVESLTSDYGDSVLIKAVQGSDPRQEEEVRLLLAAGADPQYRPRRHSNWDSGPRPTALERAIARGQAGIVKLLLEHGAEPDAKALADAARSRDLPTVELLLARGLQPDAEAVANALGDPDSVALRLVAAVPDSDRATLAEALRSAARLGRCEVMRALLARGVDVDARSDARPRGPSDDEMRDTTALALAAGHGGLKSVILLLEHGADPNLQAGLRDDPPLMHAARNWSSNDTVEIVRVLLAHGAKPPEKPNKAGETVLSVIFPSLMREQVAGLLAAAERPHWSKRLFGR